MSRQAKAELEVARAKTPVLRSSVADMITKGFFHGLANAGRLHPFARPELHNVEVIRDVPYAGSAHIAHRLDIYRPKDAAGPVPVVLYMHGGGFTALSKDTHWVMGLSFARAGYLVCNISYRLAPLHPYPAALEDSCRALAWVARHVEEFGGDPSRLALAGESAGANLACALIIATCYERPEPYARMAWDTGLVPRVAALGCGILQVSDPLRFARRRRLPWWVRSIVENLSAAYIQGDSEPGSTELADPLLVLERGQQPARPLPAVFAFVGTRDPILDDTRRLARALTELGVPHQTHYYPGELHAFHALIMRRAAQRCWRDKLAFLDAHLRTPAEVLAARPAPWRWRPSTPARPAVGASQQVLVAEHAHVRDVTASRHSRR